jgi:hypothetical protein
VHRSDSAYGIQRITPIPDNAILVSEQSGTSFHYPMVVTTLNSEVFLEAKTFREHSAGPLLNTSLITTDKQGLNSKDESFQQVFHFGKPVIRLLQKQMREQQNITKFKWPLTFEVAAQHTGSTGTIDLVPIRFTMSVLLVRELSAFEVAKYTIQEIDRHIPEWARPGLQLLWDKKGTIARIIFVAAI